MQAAVGRLIIRGHSLIRGPPAASYSYKIVAALLVLGRCIVAQDEVPPAVGCAISG